MASYRSTIKGSMLICLEIGEDGNSAYSEVPLTELGQRLLAAGSLRALRNRLNVSSKMLIEGLERSGFDFDRYLGARYRELRSVGLVARAEAIDRARVADILKRNGITPGRRSGFVTDHELKEAVERCGSASAAGRELGLHRTTVKARLDDLASKSTEGADEE